MRADLCESIGCAIERGGQALHVYNWLSQDDQIGGLAVVTEIAGELAKGATALFRLELWYAGSALVRQLIETEYLLFRFKEHPAEAATWLSSSSEAIRKNFQPNILRKNSNGKFRDQEYWTHCDIGGHPSPKAKLVLKNHSSPLSSPAWAWLDLALHLRRVWHNLIDATVEMSCQSAFPTETIEIIDAKIIAWEAKEPQELMNLNPAIFKN